MLEVKAYRYQTAHKLKQRQAKLTVRSPEVKKWDSQSSPAAKCDTRVFLNRLSWFAALTGLYAWAQQRRRQEQGISTLFNTQLTGPHVIAATHVY